ncbi:MAG: helix-turn-helix transcriptional regulator [Phenylobacterium sp.]|uniref:helix-turn-helix domain-containing protein n=1 Tax=Phenylobacterium sp. TaxID=1871053 RepID=UPI0025EB38D9|nr:helix-turn-helix domain-containing protein [Phenylobacterium sp.]MCA6305263.1 helix-turn-helix transcriptional regulator [Phenylobacterium sp.]
MKNRIRELREAAGLSQQQLADRAGTSQPQVDRLEKGERKLTADWMRRLSEALGVPMGAILTEHAVPAGALSPRAPGPPGREVSIPELDVRAAAGDGALDDAVGDGEHVVASWSMPAAILRAQTTAPRDRMRIITVYGDSMAPDFNPGDRILVDTDDRRPSPPGVFAIWDGIGLVIKRVEYVINSSPAAVRLISRNPQYEPRSLSLADLDIRGRVIGRWQWT